MCPTSYNCTFTPGTFVGEEASISRGKLKVRVGGDVSGDLFPGGVSAFVCSDGPRPFSAGRFPIRRE